MFPTLSSNPVDTLNVTTPPELTTATITQYYPQIDTSWDLGIQQATLDSVPYSRTYNILSFPATVNRLTKVDLSAYDPDYGANFYYLVSNYFVESSYNSSINDTTDNPFSSWTQIDSCYRQELTYTHTQVGQLVYNRPQINTGGSNESGSGGVIEYVSLPIGYSININVGTALGAIITSASPIQVTLKSSTTSTIGTVESPTFILLTEPIINIKFLDITASSHTSITTTFYGQFKWRNFLPTSSNDPLTLLHPIGTPSETQLKPPGLPNLLDNFWNSNPANQVEVDLSTRNNTPQWI